MNKEELQKIVNDLQKQLQEAQIKLKNLDKQRFKPEEGEIYYYVGNDTRVYDTYFVNSYSCDCARYNSYNYFKTKEEAQKEADKILIRRKLEDIARRLNDGREIDWYDSNQDKYSIYCDCSSAEDLECDMAWTCPSQGVVYCLSKDFLQTAIEEIGGRELATYITGQ